MLWLLFSLLATPAYSQYFIWGQDPASLQWKQIETPHFRLIFPADYAERAAYLADVLEYTYPLASRSMGFNPRKIPVILHNHTVVSNGFVGWAPARLEMFSNPPPGDGVHDWHERLAVHEFRHVVQVDMLNQGITGFLSGIFGEHITAASIGLFIPFWVLEGDAVAMETALTFGGRGRLPSFEQGLRAQVLDIGIYPYEKAFLGSLRDHVPNQYELGYQLVSFARLEHGADIWGKVFEYVARRPYTIAPFRLGLKRHAGVGVKELYGQAFSMLDSAWTHQSERHTYTPYLVISPERPVYTNYKPFAFRGDSTILALKSGLEDIPRIVEMDMNGGEHLLFTPGFFNHDVFSKGGDLIAWSETRQDPRWGHRSWSEIHTFDLGAGKKNHLTRETRFFAPAVSADGKMIAVTEVTSDDRYALVVLDALNGVELYRWLSPGGAYLMQPQWLPDASGLIAVARDQTGKRMIQVNLHGETFQTIFHAGHVEIANPRFLSPEKVVFNGAFSGINNIYMLDLETGQSGILVSSRLGAVDAVPSKNGKSMVYSDYTAMGYRAVFYQGDLLFQKPIDQVNDFSPAFHGLLAAQEKGLVTKDNIPRQQREVLDYSKWRNLFRFHSWGPFSLDVNNMDVKPGVSMVSQNLLSTSVTSLGYAWDMNDRLGYYYLNYSYKGLYPSLDMNIQSGLRRSWYTTSDRPDEPIAFLWRENSLKFGASVPLSFAKGPFLYGVRPSVRLGVTRADASKDTPAFFEVNRVFPLEYRFLSYWQQRSVARDIRPRWGQVFEIQYRHSPFGETDMGSVMAGRVLAYLPGVIRHHSLRLGTAFQTHQKGTPRQNRINYTFPNLIPYPRGIDARHDDRLWGLSADYAFPLGYPEWLIPSVLYVRRLHVNFFADHARGSTNVSPENGEPYENIVSLTSYGGDLIGDVRLLNSIVPIELGLRTIYLPDVREYRFQLLFTVSIP